MNIQEYISSGIVESYVLGFATQLENEEFEKMCIEHPEVLAARNSFELELELEMMKGAMSPPEELKTRILSSISGQPEVLSTKLPRKLPMVNLWRWVAAASILFFIASMFFAISAITRNKGLETANINLKKRLDSAFKADPIIAIKPFAEKPSVKWTALLENSNPDHCVAHLYWDSATKETYLLIGNISERQSSYEFHLKVKNDTKLIDLGKFTIRDEGVILKMKSINEAKSFIITSVPKSKEKQREEIIAEGVL